MKERGLTSVELTTLVREVMEDKDEERVKSLLAQWGKDVVYDIIQWGMFWQYPGVEIALPYFNTLTTQQQKTLAYEAVAEGYSEVLEYALPILNVEDHRAIIEQTFQIFPEMAQMVYQSCDPSKVIEALKANKQDEAAQWLFDMYRPVHEKQVLEDATKGIGQNNQRKKI